MAARFPSSREYRPGKTWGAGQHSCAAEGYPGRSSRPPPGGLFEKESATLDEKNRARAPDVCCSFSFPGFAAKGLPGLVGSRPACIIDMRGSDPAQGWVGTEMARGFSKKRPYRGRWRPRGGVDAGS